jgi:transposase InsO family protein
MGEHGVNSWRAGCMETCSSGSEGGSRKRTGREAGTAPRSDPYSKLKGPAKWTYFYLYVILDVFSRYVVGWTVQYRETAQLAKALIEQSTEQQQITPKILTLHADRGAPQRAKPVAFLLADLVVGSHCTSWVTG